MPATAENVICVLGTRGAGQASRRINGEMPCDYSINAASGGRIVHKRPEFVAAVRQVRSARRWWVARPACQPPQQAGRRYEGGGIHRVGPVSNVAGSACPVVVQGGRPSRRDSGSSQCAAFTAHAYPGPGVVNTGMPGGYGVSSSEMKVRGMQTRSARQVLAVCQPRQKRRSMFSSVNTAIR